MNKSTTIASRGMYVAFAIEMTFSSTKAKAYGSAGGEFKQRAIDLDGHSWTVERRFSSFVALHAALQNKYPRAKLPDLPPKRAIIVSATTRSLADILSSPGFLSQFEIYSTRVYRLNLTGQQSLILFSLPTVELALRST